eukprot:gene16844-20028_t
MGNDFKQSYNLNVSTFNSVSNTVSTKAQFTLDIALDIDFEYNSIDISSGLAFATYCYGTTGLVHCSLIQPINSEKIPFTGTSCSLGTVGAYDSINQIYYLVGRMFGVSQPTLNFGQYSTVTKDISYVEIDYKTDEWTFLQQVFVYESVVILKVEAEGPTGQYAFNSDGYIVGFIEEDSPNLYIIDLNTMEITHNIVPDVSPLIASVGIIAYDESNDDSTGQKIWGSLLNALVFLVTITLTTVAFVFLYKYRCTKVIYAWLFASVGLLLGSMGSYIFMAMLDANNLALDYISFAFLMFNFSVGGIIAIFWYAPAIMNQGYLVLISCLMAISFTRLPEWTTWTILAIISIYDLFAVLCPKGPLRVLVETAQERNETIPALIYNANFDAPVRPNVPSRPQQQQATSPASAVVAEHSIDDENEFASPVASLQQPITSNNSDRAVSNDNDEEIVVEEDGQEKKKSLKLGLGDFVFYSVLMGRAALFDMSTVFTCYVAIITGLFATLILLAIFRKALPALPISIAFGIVFYFLTRIFLYPFIETTGSAQVFI